MKESKLYCKKIIGADIYRDGGSYGLFFLGKNNKEYELHFKVIINTTDDLDNLKRNYKTGILLQGTKKVIEGISWEESKVFLAGLKFNDEIFKEIKKLVDNKGFLEFQ